MECRTWSGQRHVTRTIFHLVFQIDPVRPQFEKYHFAPGITLKLAPFFGSIGVAMSTVLGKSTAVRPGRMSATLIIRNWASARPCAGPCARGTLRYSLGDGHGLQGDGEVTTAALETSLRGTYQVFVVKGQRLKWPRAETPTHYITMGLNPDLDEAAKMATQEMIDFLVPGEAPCRVTMRTSFAAWAPTCM